MNYKCIYICACLPWVLQPVLVQGGVVWSWWQPGWGWYWIPAAEPNCHPGTPSHSAGGKSMDTTCNMFETAKVTRHRNRHGQWSRKTNSQWLHALGYIEQWSKLILFPAKFCFCKQPGGRNSNTDGQFSSAWRWLFLESTYLSPFESSLFSSKTPFTTQILTSVYLWQQMLSNKFFIIHCVVHFIDVMDVKQLHLCSCWTLYAAGKVHVAALFKWKQ